MELFDYKLTYEKIASLKAFKCGHCKRIFSTQVNKGLILGRVPLLMPCSHSICEECIKTMAKEKQVECSICHNKMSLENPEKWSNVFPVDRYMFGALLYQTITSNSNTKVFSYPAHVLAGMTPKLSPSAKSTPKIKCSNYDCDNNATQMCLACKSQAYCKHCDKKLHEFIPLLKDHVRYPLDCGDLSLISVNCQVHAECNAEYFCDTCKSAWCSKCIIKDHYGHSVIAIEDKNTDDLPAFKEVMKKACYLVKSMEHTLKEVNNEITNSKKNLKPTNTEYEIIRHFAMLHSTLQILEASMLDKFYRGQTSKIDSFHRLSEELTSNIEILKSLVTTGKMLLTNNFMDKLLISELHEKIEENLKLPCEIVESNNDTQTSKLRFVIDDSILEQIQNHCTINVEENYNFKLIPKTDFDESKFIDDNFDSLSVTSGSTNSLHQFNQSPTPSIVSSVGTKCSFKKKSGCKTRITLADSEPIFHSPVSHQKTKSKPKTEGGIQKGNEYEVTVTHIVNPSQFYIQLADKKMEIEELTKKYANYAGTALTPTSIETGKIYIVQDSEGSKKSGPKWFRGRVLSTLVTDDEISYEVFFIDYGNTSYVAINKIREMKSVFLEKPYFAHQCRLHGIMSLQKSWNNNVLKDIVEFIACQHELKMYVVDNRAGIFDVSLFSHTASLSEFLMVAGHGRKLPVEDSSTSTNTSTSSSNSTITNTNTRRSFSYNEPRISSSIQNFEKEKKYIVSITHVINPLYMYIRLEQHKDVIANIETAMAAKYDKSELKHFEKVFNPNKGLYYAASLKIQNERKWRRVEVIDVPSNGFVKVFAIDYGIEELVDWRYIRKLHTNFKNVDAQAVKVELTHIKCINNDDEWSEETNEFLEKKVLNKIAQMVVDEASKTSLSVTLYVCQQEDDICINALLVEEGFALSTGEKSQQLKLKKETKVEYCKQMSTSMVMDDKFWVAVEIVHVESPGAFYVFPLKWQKKRDKFTKELLDFYADEMSPQKKWTIDTKCIAKSNEDNLYHRAIILDVLKNDTYKVFLKDIVRTETLPTQNIYNLEDQFGIHDFLIKCRLGGMVPTGGEKSWPHSVREYFTDILKHYTHLYITQSEQIQDKILPVELIAKWEDNTGPLNAPTVHKATLNKQIIEAGLAIPVRVQKDDTKESSSTFEVMKITAEPDKDEDEDEEEEEAQFLGPKPTKWLQPYRLQEKKFQAWPTYVDSDGFIYIQTQLMKSMLTNVQRVLNNYFKNKVHDKNHVWNVGDMCTVQYHLDKMFYRGSVVDTTADGKIHVQLIDYGNVEECTAEELRTDILMTDQPPLAVKCALAHVTSKTKDLKWPVTILDTLHVSIVEKECEAFLENADYQDDQIPQITLINNHICINTTIMTWDWGKIKKVSTTDNDTDDNDEDDDDDTSVIVVYTCDDEVCNGNEEDADVVLEAPMKYSYVQLPENTDTFEGVVVNFINYQMFMMEPNFINDLMNKTKDEFQKMLLDINQFASYLPQVQEPTIGMPCVALFGTDNCWYRAEILNIDGNEIKVLFVDYGNVDIIPIDDIKEMKEEWLQFSVQMLKCTIHGIQLGPLADNHAVRVRMMEEIEGKPVICEIKEYRKDDCIFDVKLMRKNDPEMYAYHKLIEDGDIMECN